MNTSNSLFSDEIDVQRRRKGSGPQGRADAPVRRDSGGGSDGGSGGGWQPGGNMGGNGGPSNVKLPPWLMIILLIIFILFGGGNVLNSLLGGNTESTPTEVQNAPNVVGNSPTAIPDAFTPKPISKDGSTWTVMLYQDGDDQILEQDIFTDFNEAERVGSTDHVQVISQMDRFKGAFSGDENWTGARRYFITRDNDLNHINSKLMADLGEVNMADPATLVDFATWAIKTFPADHYVLILSDHGMGWPGGWTDGDMSDSLVADGKAPLIKVVGNALYSDQLDTALKKIRQESGIDKFDIIGMDACLMGQLEIMSMLSQHAQIAITSQETEPSLGWAYTAFLQALTQNPQMNAADLAKQVVQTYITDDQRIVDDQARSEFLRQMGSQRATADQVASEIGKDITISAVDLEKIPALMKNVNDLAYAMQDEDQANIAQARDYALSFTSIFGKQVPPAYIDLGSFVQILKQQSRNATIQQLSDGVLTGIKQAVLAEKHGSGKKGATGIAIYFPNSSLYRSPYSGPQSYTVIASYFAGNSLWDDFLAYHYNDQTFDAGARTAVIPSSNNPTRSPGTGLIHISKINASSNQAAPGKPVTLRAEINGTNIGYAYLFAGYYDAASNSIFVADTDYLESPDTRQVDGVYYPRWSDKGSFTMKFAWDPIVFSVTDGNKTVTALFTPQQYGATSEEAIYAVDGVYTFSDSGQEVNARLNFRNSQLVSVFGITGQGDTGAPREIIPQKGDTFTIFEKWMDLNSDGSVKETVMKRGEAMTFGDTQFRWVEQYAAAGDYVVGFVITDLDGNSTEAYTSITVK